MDCAIRAITREMLETVCCGEIESRPDYDPTKADEYMDAMPDFEDMLECERVVWATKVINAGLFKVSHGDAFHWLGRGYRNENLLFWDSQKGIRFPYTGIDDYGSVPRCFVVEEGGFSPTQWSHMVDHNGIVFLGNQLVAEIKKNLVMEDNKQYTCTIDINGSSYVVESGEQEFDNNVFHYYNGRLSR